MPSYKEIKTLMQFVGWALETYPVTRNSDQELVKVVAGRIDKDAVLIASSVERCRRFWNRKGMYWPTSYDVAKARRMNMDEWRVAFGYPTQASVGMPTPQYVPQSEKPLPTVRPML